MLLCGLAAVFLLLAACGEKSTGTGENAAGKAAASPTQSAASTDGLTEEQAVKHLTERFARMDWDMGGNEHTYTFYDKAKDVPILDCCYSFAVDEQDVITQLQVLVVGDIKTAIKAENMVVLVMAALQMYDASITYEDVKKIMAEAIGNGSCEFEDITYYFELISDTESAFYFEP